MLITTLYAGLLGLMFVLLSALVVPARRNAKAAIGDGGDLLLKRRIGAQTNFAQYTSFFILLLALAEYHTLTAIAVHAFGILFLLGRIFHAYSLLQAEQYNDQGILVATPVWRMAGMIITFVLLVLLCCVLLGIYATA